MNDSKNIYIVRRPLSEDSIGIFAIVMPYDFYTFKHNTSIEMLKAAKEWVKDEMERSGEKVTVFREPHIIDDEKSQFGAKAIIGIKNENGRISEKVYSKYLWYTTKMIYLPGEVVKI